MNRSGLIVAIDGPVGVGKSTVARELAKRLGYLYIDTGAMYRAVTWKALETNAPLNDGDAVAALAENTRVELRDADGGARVFCDGEDVTGAIREPRIGAAIAPVADNIGVRAHMVKLQREMGKRGGVVMEGRDIGTVVFPNADVKFYLDGNADIRAERRFEQLREMGKDVTLEDTLNDLLRRDKRDKSRPFGALRKAGDSTLVDTSGMTLDEVIDTLLGLVTQHPNFGRPPE